MEADTGVGRVELVAAADRGVVASVEADSGVKGVLDRGESSVRAERMVGSTGVLPDRRRLRDSWRVRRGAVEPMAGMTSGARLLGDSGWRGDGSGEPASDSLISPTAAGSTGWCGFQLWPGALMDRSCSGGRPGMVAGRGGVRPLHRARGRGQRRKEAYASPLAPPGRWSWGRARGR